MALELLLVLSSLFSPTALDGAWGSSQLWCWCLHISTANQHSQRGFQSPGFLCDLSNDPRSHSRLPGCSLRSRCVCWSLSSRSAGSQHRFPCECCGFGCVEGGSCSLRLSGAAVAQSGGSKICPWVSPALHWSSLVLAEHSEVPLLERLLDLKCITAPFCNRHKSKVLLWQEEPLEILDLLRIVSSQSVSCGNEVCLHYPSCRLSAKWG